jgi:hypothetical protein
MNGLSPGFKSADEEQQSHAARERLADRLADLEPTLPNKERLLLHRMIWKLLDPVDRAHFTASLAELSDEEIRVLDEVARELGGS